MLFQPDGNRLGQTTATTKCARGIWQEPCQPSKTPAFQRFSLSGANLSVSSDLRCGEVSNSPCGPKKRGGARNRADRESYALSEADVVKSIAATDCATNIGLPFTRMITIDWEGAGVLPINMGKATGRFIDLLTKTLARHESRTAWLWVHENGHQKGAHCHLLVHVPANLVPIVKARQGKWLRKITGRSYKKGVIHSTPIGRHLGLEVSNPELHAANLTAALHYVLKGASPEVRAKHGLSRAKDGGYVLGKRCGISQNIAAKARKAMLSD
jgi:hypothetical protein